MIKFIKYLIRRIFGDREARKITVTCVGVGYSKKYGSCPGASLDATNIYNYCREFTKNAKLFVDGSATKQNLINSFSDGVNSDLNILFYSGHGGQVSDTNNDESDKKDEHLCLYDSMIVDDELWFLISQCKGRVFLIFDCCHSETMYRSPNLDIIPKGSNVNMLCWSGCPDNSYSYGGDSGGVFTNAILKVIKNNKYLDYKTVFDSVKLKVQGSQIAKMTKLGTGWNTRIFR